MSSHGLIGNKFKAVVQNQERISLQERMSAVTVRLKKGPLSPIDIYHYAKAFEKITDSDKQNGIVIASDTEINGHGKDRMFSAMTIGLALQDGQPDVHYFGGCIYQLSSRMSQQTIRPYPIAIARAAHIALRKMSRTDVPYYYNEKFVYVLGAALLMHMALNDKRVDPLARRSVMIPTKNGFYLGDTHPIKFDQVLNMNRSMKVTCTGPKRHTFEEIPMKAAADLPQTALMLRTTMDIKRCSRQERELREKLHAVLSPAYHEGELAGVCSAYAYGYERQDEVKEAIQPFVDPLVDIIRSDLWMTREGLQKRIIAPSPAPSMRRTA